MEAPLCNPQHPNYPPLTSRCQTPYHTPRGLVETCPTIHNIRLNALRFTVMANQRISVPVRVKVNTRNTVCFFCFLLHCEDNMSFIMLVFFFRPQSELSGWVQTLIKFPPYSVFTFFYSYNWILWLCVSNSRLMCSAEKALLVCSWKGRITAG